MGKGKKLGDEAAAPGALRGPWGPVCSASSSWGHSSSLPWPPLEARREQGLPQAVGRVRGSPRMGFPDGRLWGGWVLSLCPMMGQPLLILYNKPSSSPVLDSLPALPGSLPAYSSTLGVLGPQPLPTKGTEQVRLTLPAPQPKAS